MLHRLRRFLAERARAEHGSTTLEVAVIAPAMLVFIALVVYAGRVELAGQAVQHAASEAARDASIARSAGEAQGPAYNAAQAALHSQGIDCSPQVVNVDASGFGVPVGTPAHVTVHVSCRVSLGSLSAPGVPGHQTLSATASSPIDTYRGRTG